jgi:hypothetical protein
MKRLRGKSVRKDVTVNLNCIEARGFYNHIHSPRSPNVKIDPVAMALAAEILYTYWPKNMEEFKQRAIEHMRKKETKDNLIIGAK